MKGDLVTSRGNIRKSLVFQTLWGECQMIYGNGTQKSARWNPVYGAGILSSRLNRMKMEYMEVRKGMAPYEKPMTEVFAIAQESAVTASGGTESFTQGQSYGEDSFEE